MNLGVVTQDPIDLNDLAYLAQVVEHGGYSAAERALGIPKSRLSRRISELEARLGVRLLQRTTRRLSLTEAGELLLKHCRAMLIEAQTGIDVISNLKASPRGKVRVSCPMNASRVSLAKLLPGFFTKYPEVRVEVLVTNRVVDLYEDGLDIALRIRTTVEEVEGIATELLWKVPRRLVAAPALLRQYNRPSTLEDLRSLPTVDFNFGNAVVCGQ